MFETSPGVQGLLEFIFGLLAWIYILKKLAGGTWEKLLNMLDEMARYDHEKDN